MLRTYGGWWSQAWCASLSLLLLLVATQLSSLRSSVFFLKLGFIFVYLFIYFEWLRNPLLLFLKCCLGSTFATGLIFFITFKNIKNIFEEQSVILLKQNAKKIYIIYIYTKNFLKKSRGAVAPFVQQ